MDMRDKIADIIWEHETGGVDHKGAADAILAALPNMIAPQWQTIETAPQGVDVLVTCGGTPFVAQFDPHPNMSEWWVVNSNDKGRCNLEFYGKPTHWMPLPKPPEKTNDYAG